MNAHSTTKVAKKRTFLPELRGDLNLIYWAKLVERKEFQRRKKKKRGKFKKGTPC